MELIPERTLARYESLFDAALVIGLRDPVLLADPLFGNSLKFYLLLTETPDLLAAERFSPEQVFWSRYYWFIRYSRLRQTAAGCDAGLDPQALRILEHPQPECEPDWNELEHVERLAERDAELHLRRLSGSLRMT